MKSWKALLNQGEYILCTGLSSRMGEECAAPDIRDAENVCYQIYVHRQRGVLKLGYFARIYSEVLLPSFLVRC